VPLGERAQGCRERLTYLHWQGRSVVGLTRRIRMIGRQRQRARRLGELGRPVAPEPRALWSREELGLVPHERVVVELGRGQRRRDPGRRDRTIER
jgi:hypothetical protein